MKRRYQAFIKEIGLSVELDGKELCTFVTHFGNFGDIVVYDQKKNECILNTKGVILDSFYPDMDNREMAQKRAGHISYMFEDYKYQKKLKYPQGRLRSLYKEIVDMDRMEDTITVCDRCLSKVYPSCSDEYDYQCYEHDEELYAAETHVMDKKAYLELMAKRTGCPRDRIEKLHCEYDAYISKCYLHDDPADCPMTLQEFYNTHGQVKELSYTMAMKF